MNYKIIFQLIILLNFLTSNPYKQLDIDFLKIQSNVQSVKKNYNKCVNLLRPNFLNSQYISDFNSAIERESSLV